MESAHNILKKHCAKLDKLTDLLSAFTALGAMEEYAEQWKYDYSKECKCNDSPGSTWCCNLCGLPITPKRDKDEKILEWMDLNLSTQSKLGASDEVIKQLLAVRSFYENYPK